MFPSYGGSPWDGTCYVPEGILNNLYRDHHSSHCLTAQCVSCKKSAPAARETPPKPKILLSFFLRRFPLKCTCAHSLPCKITTKNQYLPVLNVYMASYSIPQQGTAELIYQLRSLYTSSAAHRQKRLSKTMRFQDNPLGKISTWGPMKIQEIKKYH